MLTTKTVYFPGLITGSQISKKIVHVQLKQSIIMTGIVLILLFGANSSSLIMMTTYPPWGVLSITFMIVGAYFIVIGLDSAGLYIVTDSSLRSHSNIASKGLRYFKVIGSGEGARRYIK